MVGDDAMDAGLVVGVASLVLLGVALLPRIRALGQSIVGLFQRKHILASPTSITHMFRFIGLDQDRVRECRCTLSIHVPPNPILLVPAAAHGSFHVAEGVWIKTIEGPVGVVVGFSVHSWNTASGKAGMTRWLHTHILNVPTDIEMRLRQLPVTPTAQPAGQTHA